MKILLVLGHPRTNSFSAAIAQTYAASAKESGADLRELLLPQLDFELNVIHPHPQHQYSEPDIIYSRECLKWAEHIVIISPVWWGATPALLKGWLDRVFTPGFAFYERAEGDYVGLLKGRTARLIFVMDTPEFIYNNFVKAPAVHSLKEATLELCGIQPVKTTMFSGVTYSDEFEKQNWLKKTMELAKWESGGVRTYWDHLKLKLAPWLKALRLQFYFMTFLAYTTGAFAAAYLGYGFSTLQFWLGYLLIFFSEAIAVFTNDLGDFTADKINTSYTPFNGGSRVLVNGELSPRQYNKAIKIFTAIVICIAIWFAFTTRLPIYQPLIIIASGLFLGIAYTKAPFKLSFKTLGEITVCLSHSLAVLLCGFVLQNGNWAEPLPYIISLPLFLSIIPSITLSNIPDRAADATVNKQTIAVRLGNNTAAAVALGGTVAAIIAAFWFYFNAPGIIIFGNEIYFMLLHGFWLSGELINYLQANHKPRTINKLMVLALSFMMWFVLSPFFRLR